MGEGGNGAWEEGPVAAGVVGGDWVSLEVAVARLEVLGGTKL